MGDLDELNSVIELLLTEELPAEAITLPVNTQHRLFDLAGEIAMPEYQILGLMRRLN